MDSCGRWSWRGKGTKCFLRQLPLSKHQIARKLKIWSEMDFLKKGGTAIVALYIHIVHMLVEGFFSRIFLKTLTMSAFTTNL